MTDLHICAVDGCRKPRKARGYCKKNWARWKRNGHPFCLIRSERGAPLHFLENNIKNCYEKECLIWPFAKSKTGTAQIRLCGKTKTVARIACEERNGPPPDRKFEVAHNCGNGKLGCVNPSHLRWASHIENMGDMVGHGTRYRGDKAAGAKLTIDDVLIIRKNAENIMQKDFAVMFNVSRSLISKIMSHKNRKYG